MESLSYNSDQNIHKERSLPVDECVVIDEYDRPELEPYWAGIEAWHKYRDAQAGGDIYALNGGEVMALKNYLQSELCNISEVVQREVLDEITERIHQERKEDQIDNNYYS